MMSRGYLCVAALLRLYWVHGVDFHQCAMRYYIPPIVFYLPRLLTRAFSLSHFFFVIIAYFSNAGRTDTPSRLSFLNLPVLLRRDLLLP
jgi:hypothetical protein